MKLTSGKDQDNKVSFTLPTGLNKNQIYVGFLTAGYAKLANSSGTAGIGGWSINSWTYDSDTGSLIAIVHLNTSNYELSSTSYASATVSVSYIDTV